MVGKGVYCFENSTTIRVLQVFMTMDPMSSQVQLLRLVHSPNKVRGYMRPLILKLDAVTPKFQSDWFLTRHSDSGSRNFCGTKRRSPIPPGACRGLGLGVRGGAFSVASDVKDVRSVGLQASYWWAACSGIKLLQVELAGSQKPVRINKDPTKSRNPKSPKAKTHTPLKSAETLSCPVSLKNARLTFWDYKGFDYPKKVTGYLLYPKP